MNDKLKPLTGTEYEIGYSKPPKATQFQKGKSGNPKGRPKKGSSISDVFEKELRKKKSVVINGKTAKLTHLEIMMAQLIGKAAKGDQRAIRDVLQFGQKISGEENTLNRSKGKNSREDTEQSVSDDDLLWMKEQVSRMGQPSTSEVDAEEDVGVGDSMLSDDDEVDE